MLFFQCGLLAGYGYGHKVARAAPARKGIAVHIALLACAALSLAGAAALWGAPLIPPPAYRPAHSAFPVPRIAAFLALSLGLPCVALSATTPLLQYWFGQSCAERSPYRLYALSNAGSLAALLSYPFLIEVFLTLRQQVWIWTAGFAAFAALCAACALSARAALPSTPVGRSGAPRTAGPGTRLLWGTLAACPSVLLLATTNQISEVIPPAPLIWIAPLSVYLVSFMLCFDSDSWHRRGWYQGALAAASVAAALALHAGAALGRLPQLGILLGALFVTAMVCHGELARLRPPAGELTDYYLSLSAGGAAGGVFAVLVAPWLFRGYWEYHLAFLAAAVLAVVLAGRDRDSWMRMRCAWQAAAGLFLAASACAAIFDPRFKDTPWETLRATWFGPAGGARSAAAGALFLVLTRSRKPALWVNVRVAAAFLALLAVMFGSEIRNSIHGARDLSRGFFGALKIEAVAEDDPDDFALQLLHGTTMQGRQYQAAARRREPTIYFGDGCGLDLAFRVARRRAEQEKRGLRVGLIGLGAGTLAAYTRAGDELRVYEVDPQVVAYSTGPRPMFTYLADTPARTHTVLGDGRIALEAEPPRDFDVLVVDAFTGFSVPVHLLTREAISLYLSHLNSGRGILIFNIGSEYLDLESQLRSQAACAGVAAAFVSTWQSDGDDWLSDWFLMSPNPAVLESSDIRKAARLPRADVAAQPCWTDDFSSVFRSFR